MAQQTKKNDLFSRLNFFMQDSYSFFPVNNMMTSGFKLMEEASEFSKDFLNKGFDGSNFMSFFQNTADVMTSSYSGYFEIMGFISKETHDELIKKYNQIQEELNKHKNESSQKDNKIKNQEKKLKTLEKDIKAFEKQIKNLENELAAEKIDKVTAPAK